MKRLFSTLCACLLAGLAAGSIRQSPAVYQINLSKAGRVRVTGNTRQQQEKDLPPGWAVNTWDEKAIAEAAVEVIEGESVLTLRNLSGAPSGQVFTSQPIALSGGHAYTLTFSYRTLSGAQGDWKINGAGISEQSGTLADTGGAWRKATAVVRLAFAGQLNLLFHNFGQGAPAALLLKDIAIHESGVVKLAPAPPLRPVSIGGVKVTVFPTVSGLETSPDFRVQVQGISAPVVRTAINNDHENWSWNPKTDLASLVNFDFEGPITVTVDATTDFTGVEILPRSAGVVPTIQGRRITFTLKKPARLELNLTGTSQPINSLHLFANELEVPPASLTAPNLIYFGPGRYDAGQVKIEKDNTTIYIAGGAVVRGWFRTEGRKNIRLLGHGIIDGSQNERGKRGDFLAFFHGCQDVQINGLTLLDNSGWHIVLAGCENVQIRNCKIIAARAISDGIDICNSQKVTVSECFIRNWDDGIALKGVEVMGYGPKPLKNVTISDSTFHCDNSWGQPFALGFETFAEEISGVAFKNCDVIFCQRLAKLHLAQ